MEYIVVPKDPNRKFSVLLGMDFLEANSIKLEVRDRLLVKYKPDGSEIRVHLNEDGSCRKVMLCNIPCYAANEVHMKVRLRFAQK